MALGLVSFVAIVTLSSANRAIDDQAELAEIAPHNALLQTEEGQAVSEQQKARQQQWSMLKASLQELGQAAAHAEKSISSSKSTQENTHLELASQGHFTHAKQETASKTDSKVSAHASQHAAQWSNLKASLAELGEAAAHAERTLNTKVDVKQGVAEQASAWSAMTASFMELGMAAVHGPSYWVTKAHKEGLISNVEVTHPAAEEGSTWSSFMELGKAAVHGPSYWVTKAHKEMQMPN